MLDLTDAAAKNPGPTLEVGPGSTTRTKGECCCCKLYNGTRSRSLNLSPLNQRIEQPEHFPRKLPHFPFIEVRFTSLRYRERQALQRLPL